MKITILKNASRFLKECYLNEKLDIRNLVKASLIYVEGNKERIEPYPLYVIKRENGTYQEPFEEKLCFKDYQNRIIGEDGCYVYKIENVDLGTEMITRKKLLLHYKEMYQKTKQKIINRKNTLRN